MVGARTSGVGARRPARVAVLMALLVGACGDDFVGATDTDSGSGGSTGDTTAGTVPTSTNPPTTDSTTEPPPPTTSATSTSGPTGTEPTGDTMDTTSPGTITTIDTDASTGTTDATGTATDASTGGSTGDTDSGGDPIGRSVSQTVNGGTKASSANFSMVFTLGQPTQNQGVSQSTNFRLQGGLIGANGNPP